MAEQPGDTPVGEPVHEPVTGDATIVELLHVLGTHMHALGTRFAAAEQLHPTDVQALSILAMSGGRLTAGDLARSLQLSSGATTRLIDRLERVGHVVRRQDDADRRRRHVAITPTAMATAGGFFGQLGQLIEHVLDGYGPAERTTIEAFLRDLTAAMEHHEESNRPESHRTD